MLVTFKTKAYANITMYEDDARALLKLMGVSDAIPNALLAPEVGPALSRLRQGLAAVPAQPPLDEEAEKAEEDKAPPLSLSRRAFPLMQLLEAAVKRGAEVLWE